MSEIVGNIIGLLLGLTSIGIIVLIAVVSFKDEIIDIIRALRGEYRDDE